MTLLREDTLDTSLPIDLVLPRVVASLREHARLVLQAPTGAGKTTRVPPALLAAGIAGPKILVMLEPRRVAARAAARRMAHERGEKIGETVGYHVRFDRLAGPKTRILVVTEGVFLRLFQNDPYLESVGAVLFDEFHERRLENDLALGLVKLIQQTIRPEMRIVVMSATLEGEAVSRYLGGCPLITSLGRLHPVKIVYDPRGARESAADAAADAVESLLEQTPGDLLVFLPGVGEIRQTAERLEDLARTRGLTVAPLYGDLPAEQQDAALLCQPRRRIVLATNVAETSVTVEGVTGVIDTGLVRQMTFDPGVALDRLLLTPISKASADQRAGRAGRTGPGLCVRLWSEASHRQRPDQTEPEIRRVDLAGAVLSLLAWGESNLTQFPWLDPPHPAALERAFVLLDRLDAVRDKTVTELGQTLARMPVHPRLGRLMLEGHRHGQAEAVALAAALLSERDPFLRPTDGRARPARHVSESDLWDRIEALEEFERTGQSETTMGRLNPHAARFILRSRAQLSRAVRQEAGDAGSARLSGDDALARSLLAAFPDRLVRRREPGSRRGLMVGGRGVVLGTSSAVVDSELFLALDVDAGSSEALARLASAVRREWLPADRLKATVEVFFEESTAKVVARRRLSFEGLVLEESPAAIPEDQAAEALALAALEHLDRVIPANDSPAGQYLQRLHWLRAAMPELQLPSFDRKDYQELLSWICPAKKSFAELQRADWLSALKGRLTHAQRQTLEREAPEKLEVPSGSHITLTYEAGRPPVLAVRIQEVFGWRETPRLAAGRVAVLLHLLAPNDRPQQVTHDLASFWANTYQQVRKELRARYPKHSWPEDPWTAPAMRGPKKSNA